MKGRFILALTVSAMLILSANLQAQTYFTGNLNSAQEVPTNASTATGFGRVTLNAAQTQINVSVYYSGLTSPGTTVGHIHGPAVVGANGPVIFNLAPTAGQTSGSVVNATFAISPTQVADLKAGLYYYNIHTTTNPGGEIRGQIQIDSPFVAVMNGGQENPALNVAGAGSGNASLNAAGTQAIVSMSWSGLSGNATVGHIHSGRSRANGPVICNLTPPTVAAGAVNDFLCTLSAAQATALKTGQLYFNVHTSANPGGELRGQIQRRRSTVLDFDGDSKTDLAIVRANIPALTTEWWVRNSSNGSAAGYTFGLNTDAGSARVMGGDFDNDGRDDLTLWRTGAAGVASFYILQSATNTIRQELFGQTNDDPRVIYDYDGDGRCDPAVYRSGAQSIWFYRGSLNNPNGNVTFVPWGTTGDFANPGDYDGDGKGDFTLQRGANVWTLNSSNQTASVNQWGTGGAFIAPGDYDGDGKVEYTAVLTEANVRTWYPFYSTAARGARIPWGLIAGVGAQTRTQGDFDGDGITDIGSFYTGNVGGATGATYWILNSNGRPVTELSPVTTFQWGITGDISVNAYNIR